MKLKPRELSPLLTESQVLAGTLEALQFYGIEPERRNVGGVYNPRGQYVAFSHPGDSDVTCLLPRHFGACAGKRLDIETKRQGWRPERARGRERARFEAQLARLKRVNAEGGYGTWLDDPTCVVHVLERIREGWRVEFDERGYPYLEAP